MVNLVLSSKLLSPVETAVLTESISVAVAVINK